MENKGTATLKGTNTITDVTEAGNLVVNDGKTTVFDRLEQNSVIVANDAALEAVLDKFVVYSPTINNGVLNLLGDGAINKDITGNGKLNLEGNVDCDTSVGLGYAYTNTKGNTNSRKSSISAQNVFVYGKYQPALTYIRGAFIYIWICRL